MRARLLFLLLALRVAALAQSFGFVQANSTTSASSLAFTSDNTPGNAIVVVCAQFHGSVCTGVTDTQGNQYFPGSQPPSGSDSPAFWQAINIKSGANTVIVAGTTGFYSIVILEYTTPTTTAFGLLSLASQPTSTNPVVLNSFSYTPTETLWVSAAYDTNSCHSWTAVNATIRAFTCEAYGETLVVGDTDLSGGFPSAGSTVSYVGGGAYGSSGVAFVLVSGGSSTTGYRSGAVQ
jgi:hypothetical protein